MYLKNLKIKNFRNLSDTSLTFSENVNVITGKNAQGKTNLLEAIWLLSGNKSFRNAKDREFASFEDNRYFIDAEICEKEKLTQIKIGCEINGSLIRKKVVKDNKEFKSRRSLLGQVPMTVFSPDDLELIKSSPSKRRDYLDNLLILMSKSYATTLNNYLRITAQKNSLLKNEGDDSLLDIYNRQQAAFGTAVVLSRIELVKKLIPYAKKCFYDMAGQKENIDLIYKSTAFEKDDKKEKAFLAELFYKKLCENKFKEKRAKMSLYGPHRDDLEILVNSKEAKLFASQGQQRSAVLSLLLSKTELIKNQSERSPIVILDDVMSELDSNRQSYILEKIEDFQVFISCCQDEIFKSSSNKKVFLVDGGNIKEV